MLRNATRCRGKDASIRRGIAVEIKQKIIQLEELADPVGAAVRLRFSAAQTLEIRLFKD
jgi:hypothetical protein